MRILLAISLLLLLLFQTASYLLVFKIQQYQIRKEIKQQIKAGVPEDELVLLKIPLSLESSAHNDQFQRIHDREFRYQGEMYDIVRQEQHGDTTWYYCLWDEKESELFAQLDEQVAQQMNQNPAQKKQHEQLDRLLHALYLTDSKYYLFSKFINNNHNKSYYTFVLKNWSESPPTPPPIL